MFVVCVVFFFKGSFKIECRRSLAHQSVNSTSPPVLTQQQVSISSRENTNYLGL